ncbi:MAG: fused MFS/spermidine synthase [Verrucomicrobiales bacterium]
MNPFFFRISLIIFISGFCSLVYQTAWLREFRLVFGASTAATAAVVAIFMGGLGVGGLWLGSRSERWRRPLQNYAWIEIGIALTAALTPVLVLGVRWFYAQLGGTFALGTGLGTVVRLLLSALVLLPPTILMGATLPAVARAMVDQEDTGRKSLSWLYGINTLGAVTGAMLATFFMLELFGTRLTLWIACLVNLAIGVGVLPLARSLGDSPVKPAEPPQADRITAPKKLGGSGVAVLVAAGVAGFVFFLMELVWFRMLSPILGGTTFTFGLILAVALAGVGIGGLIYSVAVGRGRATWAGLALTFAVEGLLIAIPFALGDSIAILAQLISYWTAFGFTGQVLGWTLVTAVVVFPASLIAGIQFPLIISLMGQGREGVGRDTGVAYGCNTLGAILGSLAGGFGFLPLLTAPGAWSAMVFVCGGSALIAAAFAWREKAGREDDMRGARLLPAGAALAMGVWLVVAFEGPTAAWRHGGIGAGRFTPSTFEVNPLKHWKVNRNRALLWEAEGVEAGVGVLNTGSLSLIVNGKSDGNLLGDIGTQIMAGLVGAALHEDPKTCLVIGLGTGSSAGWMAVVPGVERVDVVELEPAVVDVARACADLNWDVVNRDNVNLMIGDAREFLIVKGDQYDVILSEPSNPYRAGVASMFTQEYYQAAVRRLNPGGIFVQWLQAYEIDNHGIGSAYATLRSVFPHVQTWSSQMGDMLLVASMEPIIADADRMRPILEAEPFREATLRAWGTFGFEGFLSHLFANDELATTLARQSQDLITTDDLQRMEFTFARNLGRSNLDFSVGRLRRTAELRGWDQIEVRGEVNWDRVRRELLRDFADRGVTRNLRDLQLQGSDVELAATYVTYVEQQYEEYGHLQMDLLEKQPDGSTPRELLNLAHALVESQHPDRYEWVGKAREIWPVEADILQAIDAMRGGDFAQWIERSVALFDRLRTEITAFQGLQERWLDLLRTVSPPQEIPQEEEMAFLYQLFEATDQSLAVYASEAELRFLRRQIAEALRNLGDSEPIYLVLRETEPLNDWSLPALTLRMAVYEEYQDPLAAAALNDFRRFVREEPPPYSLPLREGDIGRMSELFQADEDFNEDNETPLPRSE